MKFSYLSACSRLLLALPLFLLPAYKVTAQKTTAGTLQVSSTCTISNNVISGSQTVCVDQMPKPLTGSHPAGGTGIYSYEWQSSTTGSTTGYILAAGVNNAQHYQPVNLSQITWFRRVVRSGDCILVSEAIEVTAMPPCAPLGVAEDAEIQVLQLYPNPADAVLNLHLRLEGKGPVTIAIYDVAGKLLYVQDGSSTAGAYQGQVNVKPLPTGLYHMKVTTENTTLTRRFVKH